MIITDSHEKWIRTQPRFRGIFEEGGKFTHRVPLTSRPMFAEEKEYMDEAAASGFDGTQKEKLAEELEEYTLKKNAVLLASGVAAMHMALKLAAEELYGSASGIMEPDGPGRGGALRGKRVFVADFAPYQTVAPVLYEGGEPVFIDCGASDGCMDPEVLEIAFAKYPDVKIVVANHAYGYPDSLLEIKLLCRKHGALFIEDASEAFGAEYFIPVKDQNPAGVEEDTVRGLWAKAGFLGDYAILDFGKGRIVSGESGGALLTNDLYAAKKAQYWASGATARAAWGQYEELGYDCIMTDMNAALIRGQMRHVDEIITKKKRISELYREKLEGGEAYFLSEAEDTRPNWWMTCMTCESSIVFQETRDGRDYTYTDGHGTAAPMEIYDALRAFGAEASPLYRPLSGQPLFANCESVTLDGFRQTYEDFWQDDFVHRCHRADEYFRNGIALPSGTAMSEEEQDRVIEIILACYDKADLDRLAWMG